MKKFSVIWFLILFVCGTSACALFGAEQIMSEEDEKNIVERYARELAYISEQVGAPITTIDSGTLEQVKEIAFGTDFHHEAYDFQGLMQDIALAIMDHKQSEAPTPLGITVPGTYQREVLATGRLYAEVSDQIPVGAQYSYSYTDSITISSGVTVQGYALSTQFSHGKTATFGFDGPKDDTDLSNGRPATTRIVFVLVSGTLVHETYDYIDDYGQLTRVDRVFIEKDSAKVSVHTTLASFSFSNQIWEIEDVQQMNVYSYGSEESALNDLRTNPGKYV